MNSAEATYSIRGGSAGRERLHLLSRVLQDSTLALLERTRLGPGHSVLDLGCGGGDVSLHLARKVGPNGRVVGVDADAALLEIARTEAKAQGLTRIEYRVGDAREPIEPACFDLMYSRFLLSHLAQPQAVLANCLAGLRPGGEIAIEDIDFSGHACWPDHWAARRAAELCAACMKAGGGDPTLGLQLPQMLLRAGFEAVSVNVVQILALRGDAKHLYTETVRNVVDAARRHGLAGGDEVAAIVDALETFAERPDTLLGTPRVLQVRARRSH